MDAPADRPGDIAERKSSFFHLDYARFIRVLGSAIVIVLLGMAALVYYQVTGILTATGAADDARRVKVIRAQLEQRLSLYNDLVRGYAKDADVRDALTVENEEAAVAWSHQVRQALPQTVGAALFTIDGAVLGDAGSQQVGQRCVSDLNARSTTGEAPLLPIHDDVPSLAHFDVTAPVRDDNGELLGLVFVSFGLGDLYETLDQVSASDGAAAIVDLQTGRQIAISPNWRALVDNPLLTAGLAGSQWQLQVKVNRQLIEQGLPRLAVTVVMAVLLLLLLLWTAERYIAHKQHQATHQLRDMLTRVREGELLEESDLVCADRFFASCVDLRDELASLAEQHRALRRDSQHDHVAGLANRRALEQHLKSLLTQGRQHPSIGGFSLVLLTLDGLSGVNDRYGHAIADQLLHALGQSLQDSVRGSDLVSRWSDDVFAAILPRLAANQFQLWMGRVRSSYIERQESVACTLSDDIRCRIGVGHVYVMPGDGREVGMLIAEVEQQLLQSKDRPQRQQRFEG